MSLNNFQGLTSILPQIDNAIPNAVSAQGITKGGLLQLVFPNAEELFNTTWWAKFIESYMKSPLCELMKNLNVQFLPELHQIIPGIFAGRGSAPAPSPPR